MRFCSIASGSSGNVIYVGSDHTSVLIDAGLSGKRIEDGLHTLDASLQDIDAVLITHEHSDHIKGLGVLARRYELPIYATKGTWDAIDELSWVGKIPKDLRHTLSADEALSIGDLQIDAFHISHDAAEPVGYRLFNGEKSAAIATDMGIYDDYTIQKLSDLDVVLLEANHDVRMLEAGRYPYYLKLRILSEHGHLSNESAGHLLSEILHNGTKQIYLGHLSRENNFPELAYETVCQEVTGSDHPFRADDFSIAVALREEPGEAFIW